MRGGDERSGSLFSYVRSRVRGSARTIRCGPSAGIVGTRGSSTHPCLRSLGALFAERPSFDPTPEKLLRAMLLQAGSIRSARNGS